MIGLPRDIGILILGAVFGAILGYIGSVLMWRLQLREERRKERATHALRGLHLSIASLTYLRCLLSAKTQGMKGFLNLPDNPVDELMGLAVLHLPEVVPLTQQLHDKQQDLFAHSIEAPDAADSMIRIARECEPIVNQLIKQLQSVRA